MTTMIMTAEIIPQIPRIVAIVQLALISNSVLKNQRESLDFVITSCWTKFGNGSTSTEGINLQRQTTPNMSQ
jgi:hypothetical protein